MNQRKARLVAIACLVLCAGYSEVANAGSGALPHEPTIGDFNWGNNCKRTLKRLEARFDRVEHRAEVETLYFTGGTLYGQPLSKLEGPLHKNPKAATIKCSPTEGIYNIQFSLEPDQKTSPFDAIVAALTKELLVDPSPKRPRRMRASRCATWYQAEFGETSTRPISKSPSIQVCEIGGYARLVAKHPGWARRAKVAKAKRTLEEKAKERTSE